MENNRNTRIKNPDIGYITIDEEGRICSCNDLAAALLRADGTQLLNSRLADAIAGDNRFKPLAERLKEPLKTLQNEQFHLPDFDDGKKTLLTFVSSDSLIQRETTGGATLA